MSYFLDTNILIRFIVKSSPEHLKIKKFIQDLTISGDEINLLRKDFVLIRRTIFAKIEHQVLSKSTQSVDFAVVLQQVYFAAFARFASILTFLPFGNKVNILFLHSKYSRNVECTI